ncbi:hypothetical protein D8824_05015 [Streptococcus intermedius]|uniref:hypothetical protein n=1 Tax=Streptococcus intermedius TaxID=1338 RepID=UPI000F67CE75|nr:hypothetical protein [Streptococcus intermedius]RSJ09663.1 hypothetical protein D8833_07430 [Streptococcus intermedius]RSJ16088.1 hypothetical protein D8831_05015 [Streptococcus intermedius]RSJ30837.1 hypothetical protein D8824_05015 [Streptococcus intermedius]
MRIDFRTNNPRWGLSGLSFIDLEEYAYELGFLTNIRHYKSYSGLNYSDYDESIEIQIEGNYVDGAWARECRIHYFKDLSSLINLSQSLNSASSAGRQPYGIMARINSNNFINHLISEYDFEVSQTGSYSEYVTPSSKELVSRILEDSLLDDGIEANRFLTRFEEGFNL